MIKMKIILKQMLGLRRKGIMRKSNKEHEDSCIKIIFFIKNEDKIKYKKAKRIPGKVFEK